MTDQTDDEGFMTTETIMWLDAQRRRAERKRAEREQAEEEA